MPDVCGMDGNVDMGRFLLWTCARGCRYGHWDAVYTAQQPECCAETLSVGVQQDEYDIYDYVFCWWGAGDISCRQRLADGRLEWGCGGWFVHAVSGFWSIRTFWEKIDGLGNDNRTVCPGQDA